MKQSGADPPAERLVPFTADLIEPCATLFRAVFNAPPWNNKWRKANAHAHLREILEGPGFIGFAALEGGAPIAFAVGSLEHWSHRVTFFLREMCVRRDRQRQGVGSRLLAHLEADLRRRGLGGVYLVTQKGPPAESFYRRHGFFSIDQMIMMVHRL